MTLRISPLPLFVGLVLLLALAFFSSLALGSVPLSARDVLAALLKLPGLSENAGGDGRAELILWQLRVPRTLLGMLVGAVLALCGVAMQTLFRNPLADPGLIGVSSGAALGAAAVIVFAAGWGYAAEAVTPYLISLVAFTGGLLSTLLVYRLGRRDGQTQVAVMLLAGVALTALSGALVGLFGYLADASALRALTFWNLGTLNSASYQRLWPLAVVCPLIIGWLLWRARALNALLLGEPEARHLGHAVERLKLELIIGTALGVGAAVAAAGLIGFVGLVVPHLVRLLIGPNHCLLLPASALLGAALLLWADVLARLLLAPAELPIGIVTALLGAPFFLWLLVRGRV